ncbi:DUF6020 family protein [Microbacter sp. GSS18]|nr:DUF6020 family protein [Microbacter sp. GSS18]
MSAASPSPGEHVGPHSVDRETHRSPQTGHTAGEGDARTSWTSGIAQWVIAAVGAWFVVLALATGTSPGSIFERVDSSAVVAGAAFVGVALLGKLALWSTPRAIWAWAIPLGMTLGLSHVAGISLMRSQADLALFSPSQPPAELLWSAAQFIGTATAATWLIALALRLIEQRAPASPAPDSPSEPSTQGSIDRFFLRLREGRIGAFAWVFAAIVLARVPYLILWWPGIMPFDSLRPFSYAETGVWEQLDPIGHSFLIVGANGLANSLGWGDSGGVAIGAIVQLATNSAAFAFMLTRVAAWGVPGRLWAVMAGWVALLPTFGVFSVTVVKDVPFTTAFVVFLTCFGELILGRSRDAGNRLWPWIGLAASGVAMFALRNNGIIVLVASFVALAIVLRRQWRHLLGAVAVCAVAFGLYAGPLMWAVDALPTRSTETWSVPLQQIARIAQDHPDSLSAEDRAFIGELFPNWTLADIGEQYRPGISDPIKDEASRWWEAHSTTDVLSNWLRLMREYPLSAVTATLANTVGYWSPSAQPWYGHGLTIASRNDVRGIHLDIPYGPVDVGVRGAIERHELLGETLRQTPILGIALAPGLVTWLWVVAAIGVIRKRDVRTLVWFVAPAMLLLTVLAGPVSGSMRYALPFFAALPLAWAIAVTARRRARDVTPPEAAAGDAESVGPLNG